MKLFCELCNTLVPESHTTIVRHRDSPWQRTRVHISCGSEVRSGYWCEAESALRDAPNIEHPEENTQLR